MAHRQPEWEYVPEGWARARTDPRVTGWNVEPVLDRYRQLWPEWTRAIEGAGTLGADYTRSLRLGGADTQAVRTDLSWAHNAVMSYAYVLALMARDRDEISILDWGGGLGQYLPLSETLLPGVALEFHVKDVPVMCSLGRELNPRVHFHDDESWRERTYDLVFASSALQYAEDWRSTLGALAHAASRRLYISRLPTVSVSPSFVVLQRAESYGLETQFLGWFLNRTELAECARRAGLELVREFLMMDETPAHGAPEQAEYRGFLFRPA